MSTITDTVDNSLAANLPTLRAAQAAHHAEHGKYMQLLRSCSAPPADGAAVVPDRWATAKIPGGKTWQDAFGGAAAKDEMASEWINEYVGPHGAGWVLWSEVLISGVAHRRAYHEGPEAWRSRPWSAGAADHA